MSDATSVGPAQPPAATEVGAAHSPVALTYTLLVVLLAAFAIEVLLSLPNVGLPFVSISPSSLIALGGIFPPSVHGAGEWHRLLIAPLLHVDLLHLLFNGIALYFAGSVLERTYGRACLGTLFFLGGLGGSALSLAMGADNVVSVGASGAIMALLVAVLITAFRFPSGPERTGVLTACAQILIPALIPHNSPAGMTIDVSAHVGGAMAGAVLGGALMLFRSKDREQPVFALLVNGLAALGLIATAWAAVSAVRLYPDYRTRTASTAGATAQDFAARRQTLERAAARGDATAMFELGAMFEQGQGVPQDLAQARAWYEQAAAKGHAAAMNEIGTHLANGSGVAQDVPKALEWFERAAARDNTNAIYNIGYVHASGLGVAQDYVKARPWLERAAAKGDANAMRILGIFFENGYGVAQDYTKAKEWHEKAAAKGDITSMNNLGSFYVNATGVAQDYVKARSWYEKAAAQGQPDALRNLAGLYASGLGVPRDDAKAAEWYGRGAAAGDAFSMVSLAVFADQGKGGVAQNPLQTAQLLLQAAKAGNGAARELLASEMAGWERATLAALRSELARLGHLRAAGGDRWDQTARGAVAAYLAQP